MQMKRLKSLVMKPFNPAAAREAGMTIIEILIVIALIGTIMTIVMTNVIKSSDDAKVDLTRVSAAQLENALRLYKLHNNKYPTTDEGLDALIAAPGGAKNWRGPYTEADKLNDPWGNKFSYEGTGRAFKIISNGLDNEPGTEDDIVYPPEAANAPAEGN